MSDFKVKLPLWLKIFSIISGILILGFAIITFVNVTVDFIDYGLILGIAILLIGTTRIFIGIFDKRQTKWFRLFNIIIGLLILPIGIIAYIGLTIDELILLDILALAILLLGIIGIVKGFDDKKKVFAYRISVIFVGFILVGLASSVLILDTILIADNLTYMLASGLVLLGLKRLMEGVLDHIIFKQLAD